MSNIRFGQFALYKGLKGTNGAFQFQLKPASIGDRDKVEQGCIFINAAPAIGDNVYDWQNQKVAFAISINDIMLILNNPAEVNLTHKHGDEMKGFTIKPGTRSGYFMTLSSNNKKTNKRCRTSIPMSDGEYQALKIILMQSIPAILGWEGVIKD